MNLLANIIIGNVKFIFKSDCHTTNVPGCHTTCTMIDLGVSIYVSLCVPKMY